MKRVVQFIVLASAAAAIVLALLPWTVTTLVRRSTVAAAVERLIGLRAEVGGKITLKLLPRPRLRVTDVTVHSPDGSVDAAMPVMSGDLDVAALLGGRVALLSATLSGPTVMLDVDRAHAGDALLATLAGERRSPFRLSLRTAVIRLKSSRPRMDGLLTDVDLTVHRGTGEGAEISVAGTGSWHGAPCQIALRLSRPDALLAGGVSPVSAQVTSPLATASVSGDLLGGVQPQFTGRLSAATSAASRLMTALGFGSIRPDVKRLALGGDAIIKSNDLSVSDAVLRIDDTVFEGTLGLHGGRRRDLLEGTLATERLDVDRLAGTRPDAASVENATQRLLTTTPFPIDIDLRLSATSVIAGRAELQDAAFSGMARRDRLELNLDEARLFEGTVKARTTATLRDGDTAVHGELSVTRADAGAITAYLSGTSAVAGAMTGRLEIDGQGTELRQIVAGLAGRGTMAIEDGSFVGVSLSQALRHMTRKLPIALSKAGQITPFSKATAGVTIANGVARFADGQVDGPGLRLDFAAQSDLPSGRLDLQAVAFQTDPAGTVGANSPRLPISIHTSWSETLRALSQTSVTPSLTLPEDANLAGYR